MVVLKQLSTYRDNASFSIGNVGGLMGLVAHIGYTGYDCIGLHHAFHGGTFGGGIAAILAGVAGHQYYTDSTATEKWNPATGRYQSSDSGQDG
jgi:hypothetical protein